MKADERVKRILVNNLKRWLDELYGRIFLQIKAIENAPTVEEIMILKKGLILFCLEFLPLSVNECYFCIERKWWKGDICENCPYAKFHKPCREEDSDYRKIREIIWKAIEIVGEYYYKGERYDCKEKEK